MARVTIHYKNGRSAPSFVTYDPEVIARYKGYADTDPEIREVEVTDD